MAYDKRKIANSFYLPKYPFLSGVASLLDFRGSRSRRLAEQILARPAAESMRLDWEAVLANLDLSDESRAEKRRQQERAALDSAIKREQLGMLLGFIFSMAMIIGGTCAIMAGYSFAGVAIIAADLVFLLAVYIFDLRTREYGTY